MPQLKVIFEGLSSLGSYRVEYRAQVVGAVHLGTEVFLSSGTFVLLETMATAGVFLFQPLFERTYVKHSFIDSPEKG